MTPSHTTHDEKGFLTGLLQKVRRVFNKHSKQAGELKEVGQDGNREWITCLAAICQDGTYIPPALIYQAASGNLQDTWLDDFNKEDFACYFTSLESRWTNDDVGYSWLVDVFDKNTKAKARHGRDWRLLYIDGHGSHINMQFLFYCIEHRILVAVYPPHSTHRLQPLDIGLFGPLASFYSTNLSTCVKTQCHRRRVKSSVVLN